MAVDRAQLSASLHSFYDFAGKVVLCVGAGHGQLLDPNVVTAETVLIDRDQNSFASQSATNPTSEPSRRLRTVVADFEDVNIQADVVYFEFCLHEMEDPRQAIHHARTLAPDLVIFEHLPSSEWVFYAAEEEKVCRSAQVLSQFPVKRRQNVFADQTFAAYSDLVSKLSPQGERAMQRAVRLSQETNIVIPMKCTLVLL